MAPILIRKMEITGSYPTSLLFGRISFYWIQLIFSSDERWTFIFFKKQKFFIRQVFYLLLHTIEISEAKLKFSLLEVIICSKRVVKNFGWGLTWPQPHEIFLATPLGNIVKKKIEDGKLVNSRFTIRLVNTCSCLIV